MVSRGASLRMTAIGTRAPSSPLSPSHPLTLSPRHPVTSPERDVKAAARRIPLVALLRHGHADDLRKQRLGQLTHLRVRGDQRRQRAAEAADVHGILPLL